MKKESEVRLKYGTGSITFSTEGIGTYEILEAEKFADRTREQVIEEALAHPIGTPKLSEMAKPDDQVCIIISDFTRYYQRMDLFLPYLIRELEEAGVKDQQITVLCATGAHDAQSEEQKAMLLGDALKDRFTVVDHDSRDSENMVFLGNTKRGAPIYINRLAMECDLLVLTGAVIEHDMAGYGGGRKSFLPGVASYESVVANHMQIFGDQPGSGIRPECHIGNLDGNPMHEGMCDACELRHPDFLFNLVLDSKEQYYRAVAGDWKKAFEKGITYFDEACSIPIEEKADVVIAGCGGYPKDMNLYQASKGAGVCMEAVKEGGTVIFAACCADGMGAQPSVDIITDFDNNQQREEDQRKSFVPEAFSGYFLCELAVRCRLILVTDYPLKEELEKSGMEVFRTMEEALDVVYATEKSKRGETEELTEKNRNHLTYIIPEAMSVVPKLKK